MKKINPVLWSRIYLWWQWLLYWLGEVTAAGSLYSVSDTSSFVTCFKNSECVLSVNSYFRFLLICTKLSDRCDFRNKHWNNTDTHFNTILYTIILGVLLYCKYLWLCCFITSRFTMYSCCVDYFLQFNCNFTMFTQKGNPVY